VDVTITPGDSGRGALIATGGPAYADARWALETAFGKPVGEAGEGGSIPLVASVMQAAPQAEVLLMGAEDPGALIHAPNESVDLAELETMVFAEALFLARLGGAVS
ncbi:MAG: dipeptidase, partial [bacterium]